MLNTWEAGCITFPLPIRYPPVSYPCADVASTLAGSDSRFEQGTALSSNVWLTLRLRAPSQRIERPCPRVGRQIWNVGDDRFTLHTAPLRGIGSQTGDHWGAES